MRILVTSATILATLLYVAAPARAEIEEVKTMTVSAPFDAIWGRLIRLSKREELTALTERNRFQERVQLRSANKDLGLLELDVHRGSTHRYRIHLVDETPAGSSSPKIAIRIWGSSASQPLLRAYLKKVSAWIVAPTTPTYGWPS